MHLDDRNIITSAEDILSAFPSHLSRNNKPTSATAATPFTQLLMAFRTSARSTRGLI